MQVPECQPAVHLILLFVCLHKNEKKNLNFYVSAWNDSQNKKISSTNMENVYNLNKAQTTFFPIQNLEDHHIFPLEIWYSSFWHTKTNHLNNFLFIVCYVWMKRTIFCYSLLVPAQGLMEQIDIDTNWNLSLINSNCFHKVCLTSSISQHELVAPNRSSSSKSLLKLVKLVASFQDL